jgi:hypothetical protein
MDEDKRLFREAIAAAPPRVRPLGFVSVNALFLADYAKEIAAERRAILKRHRGDRRDEAQEERRKFIANMMHKYTHMSAASVAEHMAAQFPARLGYASVRTVRQDVAAIRKLAAKVAAEEHKAGSRSPPGKS